MSTDPVNDKERRILGPKGPFAARATGGPSDASPEPREDAIAVAFAHAYQYAAYRHAAVGAFEGRLRELGFAVTPLDAERASHPPAASEAGLREALEWAMAPNPRHEGRHRIEPRCRVFMPTDGTCDCGYQQAAAALEASR